ncbi:hypothetical protein B296_00010105 [Ensete ventricosum]|uniref:Uncharacterized protein n=1 Tax=Ensete ventricosum TaxID=4639 RepID=A0A427A897_ENSVE|nr:hypothetical protein B296_00010105 [Ensete ventricosum]
MLRRVGAAIICFECRELKVRYDWLVLDIRDERRSTLGACCSVAFPRGPEGSSGGSRGTSLSSHYRTGGYPCEGEAFYCTVREPIRKYDFMPIDVLIGSQDLVQWDCRLVVQSRTGSTTLRQASLEIVEVAVDMVLRST